MLGGPVPPGMTVHTGRAVLLGVALLAFVAALGFALMAFSGMLSWVWPVAALLVAFLLTLVPLAKGKIGPAGRMTQRETA